MKELLEGQRFQGLTDINTGRVIEDTGFRRCDFFSSSLSMGDDPNRRSVVRRVRLEKCRVRASFVGNAVLDELEVNGLDTGKELHLKAKAAD